MSMTGRVTMLGISGWTGKGGRDRTVQCFFNVVIPWWQVIGKFFEQHLYDHEGQYIMVGDESVITKSGQETHGLDYYFSGHLNKVDKSMAIFTLSLVSVEELQSYLLQLEQVVGSQAEKVSAKACKKAKRAKKGRQQTKKKPGRPKGIFFRVDIDIGDNPDANDDLFGVATPLSTGWLNLKGVPFISHCIIKPNVAVFREDDIMTYILPDLVWGNLFPTQVAIDLVVAPVSAMVCKVGLGIVDLAHQQKLAMVCKVGLGIVDLAHQQKLAMVDLFDFVGSHVFNYARFHPIA